jgi:replicative DNA helicase
MVRGISRSELIVYAGDTGAGKTTIMREMAWHIYAKSDLKLAHIELEGQREDTIISYLSYQAGVTKSYMIDNWDSEWISSLLGDTFSDSRLELHPADSNFAISLNESLSKVRALAAGMECDIIILDHVSYLCGLYAGSDDDKVTEIERYITRLREICQETGVTIITASHIAKKEVDKSNKAKQRLSLHNIKGSSAISQLADVVIGIERDLESGSNETNLHVLKNRPNGVLGYADTLYPDEYTGRLESI